MYSKEITETQKKILQFIAERIQGQGCPPTIREIGRRFQIASPGSVAYHLKVLEERGLLEREGSVSRGLSPVEDPFRLPIVGRVGAGSGVIAQEDVEGHLTLDKDFLHGASFLLRVRGDSMAPEIAPGDLVQVRRQETAKDGERVVALVGEEAVVKRLRGRTLESANPAHPPIAEEFKIIGKVVGLIRTY